MKATEKKKLMLQLLHETTFNLCDDFSASITHYKKNWYPGARESYKINFFLNRGKIWHINEIEAINSVAKAFKCTTFIKDLNGVPVVSVRVE